MADPQNTTTTAAELEKDPFIKSIFKSSSIAPQEDEIDADFTVKKYPVKTELDTLRKQEMEDPLPLHRLIGEQKEFEKQYKINNPNYTSADLKKLYADFKTQRDSVRAEITNRKNRIKELTQEYNQKRADYEVWGSNGVWDKDQIKQIISNWKETGDPTWFKLQKAKTVPGVDLARIEKAEQNYIASELRKREDALFSNADPVKTKMATDLNGQGGLDARGWLKFLTLNPDAITLNPENFIDPDTKTKTRDQDLQKIVDNYFSENLLLEAESAGRRFIRTAHEKLAVAKANALDLVKDGKAVVLRDGRIAKADAPAGEGIIFDPNDYNGYLAFIPDGTNVDELVHGDPVKFAETYAAIGLMLANPNEQTFLDKKYDVLKKYWAKNGAVNAFNIARNVNYRNSNDLKRAREFDREETDAFLNIMKNPQAVNKVTDGITALAALSIMKDGGIEGKTNAEVGKRLGFFASFADGFGESFGSLSHFANNVLKGSAITATANAVLDNRFMRSKSLNDDLVSRIKTFGPEIVGLNQLSKKYKVEKKKANDKFKLYAKQLGINVTDEDLKNIEVYRSQYGNEIGTAYNDFVKENPYVDQLIDPWMRIAQKAEVAGHPIIDKDSRGNITRQGYADLEKMKKAVEMTADLLNQNAIYKSHLKANDFGRFLGSAIAEVAYMAPEAIGPGLGKLAFSGIAKGVAKSAASNAGKTAVQKIDDALLAVVTPSRGQLYILGNVPGRTATRAGLEKNWQKLNQSADGVSVDLEKLNDKESVLLSDVLPETLAEYAVGPVAGALGKLIKSGGGKLIAKVTKNNEAGKFINRLANSELVNSARKGFTTVKEFVPTQSGALGEWMEERASAIYEATFNFNNSSASLGERMRDALSFSKNWEQWGAEIVAFSIPGLAGAGGSVLIDAGKRGIGKITNNKSDRQKLIERVKAIDAFVKENSPLDYNNGNFDWAAATAAKALSDFREKHPDVNVLEVDKVTGKAINELPNHVNLTEQEVMQAALYEHYTDIYPELKNSVEKSVQNGTPAESAMTDAIRRGMIRDSIAVRTSEDFTEQQKAIVTDAVNQEYLAETIGALQSDKDLAGNSYAQEKILEAVQMMPDKESVRLLSPEAVQAQYTAIYNRLQKDFAPQMASNSVTLRNLYVNETGRTAPASAQETAPETSVSTTETAVSTPAQTQQIEETNAVTPEPATAIPATKQLNDNILPGTSKIENIDSILAESTAENKSNAEIAEQIINAENAPAAETVTETEQTATAQQTAEIPQGTTVSTTKQQQDTIKPFEPLASRDNASKAELSRIARMGLSGSYEISINNITGEKAETANAIKTLMESALGVEVVFYHNPNNSFNESGFHTGGRIFINERTLEKSEVAIRTAGHEFLHFLADSNPELYKQLQAVLLEKAKTNKLLQKEYDKTYSIYSKKGIQELNNNYSGSVNMDLINEEFTNRVFEAFFTDQNFAKEVLSNIENENPGIIKQLWEAFKKYVNAFIRAAQSNVNLRETYKEHLKEDFSKFENLLKSVIKEYQAKNRERIAQWNKQEQIQQEVVGSTAANGVQAVKVSEINVDPERFQFKQDMKKDTGVSTSSQITAKKWNPLYAGLLYLWQDKDGKLFVVNGHHRLDLAKRLGVEEINAQIDREVDGVTAEQAYIKGALINIKNGNGTVYDYANFFRKSKMSRQDALDDGFIAKGKTLAGIRANEQLKRSMTGWLIAQGSEDLWSWYVNQDENAENKITDEMFATIVEKADGVDSIELYAINAINRGAVKNMAELNSVLDGAKSRYDAANQDSGMSDGFLFGDSEADAMIEADKKLGDFARKKSNELQGLISILKKVLNNPKNAKATKIKIDKGDIRSVEQAKKDLQEYEKQKVMFDNPFINRDFIETEMRKAETGTEPATVAPAPETEKKKLIKKKAVSKTDVKEPTSAETDSKPKQKTEKTETKATLPKFKLEHIEHIDKKDVPKDVAWKDRKFKSENYYGSVRVGIMGNDAYFEFRTGLSSLQQKVFYKISDFRDTSIMQVRREIEDYFSGYGDAYPMGRNFDEALDSLHDDGMRVENYSFLKPMTASAPAAKTPKTETQSASAPAMSDEFPLLTKEEDANDFQLKGETLSEKDQQKIEDRKAEEGKKKAEKETLDLPIEENKTPASNSDYSLRKELERYKSDPVEYLDALETLIVSANNSKTLDEALDIAQEYTEYSNATRVLRAVAEHPQSTKAQKKKAEDIIEKADNERSDRALENWRKNNLMTDDFADDLKGRSKRLKPKAEKDAIERVKEIAKNINKNADTGIKLSVNIEDINKKFNDDIDRQIAGTLPTGYIYQLGFPGDILLSTGVPDLPIELSARQLKEKSEKVHHPFDINDLRDLPQMLQKPIGVFSYGDKNKAQNIIVEVQKDGKNFIVGLSLNFQHDGLVVNSIRGLYPKDLHEWLTWIQDGKSLYLNKEKIQKLIDQQRRNLADVEYLNLDSINNIIQNFENPSLSEKNSENFSNPDTVPIDFSLVEEKDLLKELESEIEKGDYLTLYRSVQVAPDGTLHSPMAGKIKGQWGPQIHLDKWEQADERPDLAIPRIDKKTGKHKKYSKKQDEGYGNPAYDFKLDKGNDKSISAAYNPYIHSSTTPLNDQFKEAYQRPGLVTIEVLVPKSELTSGYHAEKAKNSVGMKDWNAGVVQKKLSGTRQVMLSRWDKPVRIVPDTEVAQHIKKMLNGKNIAIPANVVTPSLRSELEKIGVKIDYSAKEYVAEKEVTERSDIKLSVMEQENNYTPEMLRLKKKYEGTKAWLKAPNGKPTNLTEFQWLQVRTEAFKEWFGDWESDPENSSKIVDENGEPLVVYHGSEDWTERIKRELRLIVSLWEDYKTNKIEYSKAEKELKEYNELRDKRNKQIREYENKRREMFRRRAPKEEVLAFIRENEENEIKVPPAPPKLPRRLGQPQAYTTLLENAYHRGESWAVDLVKKYIPSAGKDLNWQDLYSSLTLNDIENINPPVIFNKDKIANDGGYFGSGFYFAFDKTVADGYAFGTSKSIKSVYINSRKPAIITTASVLVSNMGLDVWDTSSYTFSNGDVVERKNLYAYLRDGGYDSVIVKPNASPLVATGGELVVLEEFKNNIKSATDNIGTFDRTNPDIRFSLLDADALKDLSPLERLTEAFEESEPNEIDRNIYIVFRKYIDELIEQGSVKQDSDFARANAVLQNYERDHGIHQASLLYRKMIADKMFVLPVFKEFIGTADEALKTAPEVPKDFANAVKTVFTGAKFKSVFTEEERKTVDHGEAIEAAQKPEDTDKEQSNDEKLLHLTDEQMEKDGYTAEQKKEQKEFAERIEKLGKKLDNKEISAKQAKDELADIYDKYTTPFDNFILRYSASANKNKKLGRNDVIGTAWIEFQNRIEDYAKSPTGDFTRSLVNATNTSITREKNETNKQRGNEVAFTNEEGKNIVEEIADSGSDTRNETDDAMRAVKKQLIGIARELRSRLENTKDKEDRLVLLRRSWVAIAIVRIGGMAYERRNVVDWLDKHIAEIEKDCENHGVVWDRTYGKGTDARYNKDKDAIFPNIHMSILSEEMNENMKKAGVLQMISSALSAAEMPTNYQKDISWLERVLIPSAQYFNKTPQIFKFYTALDDMNRYKMDMLANLTGDNGLGDNYIVTMQRLEDRKPEKAKSLYRYIIDADRFRIGGEVNVVTGNKRRYWYTYRDGSSSRDFNTAAERDKAMELDPQYKKQKLIARSEPKDIRFVATDKDGKTIGSYKSFTEAHIAVIQNEIKTLAVKGITIDGTNHKFDNEQLLALQSFRLMALNGYNQIAKRFAEIRNHIESSGGDFASFLKEQKVFDIYDEFVKMGKAASYYMPRIRKPGRYKITAKRGKETILYFVDSVSKIRLKAEIRKLKKDGWTDVEYEDTGDHTNAEIVGLDLTRLNTIVNQALQQMEKDAFKNGVLDNKMLKDSFGMELTIDSGVTDKKGNKHDNIEIVFDKSHYQAELNLALREFLKDSVAVVKENDGTITAKWIVPANQGEMLAKTFIKSIMNIHGKQTVLGSFTETLQNVIGNIIKASGYRARSIARNEKIGKEVTQGYVENPLEAMKMFLSAMAEGQSRTRFAHASAAIAGGWDYSYDDFMNEKHPGEEKSAMYYIEYCIERDKRAVKPHTQMHKDIMNTTEFVLTNADLADRMIATVNGIASIYFLSSPSSALVNTLALYTHVPTAIVKSLDESALQAVANVTGGAKRYIQYALARRNGKEAKGLTDEEKAVFGLMSRLGYDSNSNMANALATLDQNTAFGKAQKIMMASFSITESMSRASAIYAAYKAIVEKMKKQGKKFDWKNEDQLRAVLAAAKKVSDQALVDFSKGGKVGIMKNKTARKLLAPFMLFQSFSLNTINLLLKHDANIAPMLEELGLETKTDKASLIKRLVKGSAWMILSSTLLAGLDTMLPISVLQGWFGGDDDDPEKWRKEIAKQLATVFGLIPEDSTYSKVADRMLNYGATSFINLDLRGSLSTWTILQKTKFTAEEFAKRLFGAPGSLAASFSRSADEFSNAYRDGIWNPESIIRGTEYALPKLLASPLKAYRESVYGVTTLSGKSVLDPDAPDTALTEEEQKLYLTGDERDWWKSYNFYLRALGFNPADISQKRNEIYANKRVKQGYANRKKELGERIENFAQAVKDGKRSFNSAEWKQIEQDAEEMRKEYFDLPEEQRKDISQVTNKWFNDKIESVTKLSTKQKASAGDNKAKRKLLKTRQRKENESQEPIKRSK